MTSLALVSPFLPELFEKLANKRVVFLINNSHKPGEIRDVLNDHQIELVAAWLKFPGLLTEFELTEDWGDIPLALEVEGMGRTRDLHRMMNVLSETNARIYLPGKTRSQCADIRILSSLGVNTCVMLGGNGTPEVDWDALRDLAVYAIFGHWPHADIYPFSYIVDKYDPNDLLEFRSVYFNSPSSFLHVDAKGNLSLSREDQSKGVYLDLRVEEYENALNLEPYKNSLNAWKSFFIERTRCAQCEGWRVCGGAIADICDGGGDLLFQEILEGAEHARKIQGKSKQVWQL